MLMSLKRDQSLCLCFSLATMMQSRKRAALHWGKVLLSKNHHKKAARELKICTRKWLWWLMMEFTSEESQKDMSEIGTREKSHLSVDCRSWRLKVCYCSGPRMSKPKTGWGEQGRGCLNLRSWKGDEKSILRSCKWMARIGWRRGFKVI